MVNIAKSARNKPLLIELFKVCWESSDKIHNLTSQLGTGFLSEFQTVEMKSEKLDEENNLRNLTEKLAKEVLRHPGRRLRGIFPMPHYNGAELGNSGTSDLTSNEELEKNFEIRLQPVFEDHEVEVEEPVEDVNSSMYCISVINRYLRRVRALPEDSNYRRLIEVMEGALEAYISIPDSRSRRRIVDSLALALENVFRLGRNH
jgi:hypothetical protein